jgi:hypothetical protein
MVFYVLYVIIFKNPIALKQIELRLENECIVEIKFLNKFIFINLVSKL